MFISRACIVEQLQALHILLLEFFYQIPTDLEFGRLFRGPVSLKSTRPRISLLGFFSSDTD